MIGSDADLPLRPLRPPGLLREPQLRQLRPPAGVPARHRRDRVARSRHRRGPGSRRWPAPRRSAIGCARTTPRTTSATGRSRPTIRSRCARSCRLTRAIPDPSMPWQREAWYKLEVAKRRLVYSLLHLRLPVANRVDDPEHGLAFEFLADQPQARRPGADRPRSTASSPSTSPRPTTPSASGGALQLHEPYRTLLGHFRHEVGHYYWDRLIAGTRRLERVPRRCSATSAPTTARRCRRTTRTGRRPTGRPASSPPTPPRTRGRTGPRPGRTTCT